ncbi:MAG: transporter related [Bryobacterales bacterium]|nr:transporter related [Bryobacterales bacterium]
MLLSAMNVEKSYAGIAALRHASFELRAGEVHALVGENGAGKSTLIKIFTGAVQADEGEIRLNGELVEQNTPHKARTLGIVAIYQQPALFPDLTVSENLAMANEPGGLWRVLDWKARERRAKALLEEIGGHIDPGTLVSTLSMAEQQIVEIARALGGNAKVLILDEPTASLTEKEAQRLFGIIRDLRTRGVGLVYISHRLEELFEIADRVTVLRDGQVIGTREMGDVDRAGMIQMMVGRELSAVFPKREVELGDVILETRGLRSREAGIRDVSISLRRGEILGLSGMVGAGRTQFAETLFGLTPADGGMIRIAGREEKVGSPGRAIELGLAYVPEDRRRHGVIMDMPIPANITMASLGTGFLNGKRERRLAEEYKSRLQVKSGSMTAPVRELSGGNQQKVALGRWLATNPKILVLDEPTQGIDVGAKSEIHQLMGELAARGMGIIMISSELPEILGMSDRIAVMHGGTISGVLSRAEATQEKVLALALGDAPARGAA